VITPSPGTASYVVPADGVITSWSFHAAGAAGLAWLQLYAPGPGLGQYTLAAETAKRSFALGEFATTPTQIPVKAGMHLGVATQGPEPYFYAGNPGDTLGAFTVNALLGTVNNVGVSPAPVRANIAATFDPEAPQATPTVPATPATPTTTTTGPLLSVVTSGRESLRSGYVTVSATSVGPATLSATGKIGSYKLRPAGKTLQAGGRATLKLKIPKKTLRAIRLRLAHHKKVSAKVTVTAGGSTTSVRVPLVR